MSVRVRFAPSPTGYLHIGGARTALFNWLFARRQKGVFILRIEDTDVERSSPEMVEGILEGLGWLGLDWDEGPHYQSAQVERSRRLTEKLVEEGKAYRCFCSAELLQERRQNAPQGGLDWQYDGTCRRLNEQEIETRLGAGTPFAVRFAVPEGQEVRFKDLVYGDIQIRTEQIEDFVLLRSDRMPTFHLSVVADDAEMGITHVIRGGDHLPNTPKHVLLFQALGHAVPQFAHLPLILGPDKKRLSKRHGATSVLEYRKQGFLPAALLNYLARLGWAPSDDEEELLDTERLAALFEIGRVNKSNAVFDPQKLEWMNGQYLARLDGEKLAKEARPFLEESGLWDEAWEGAARESLIEVLKLLQTRAKTLAELPDLGRPFFSDDLTYEQEAVEKQLKPADAALAGTLKTAMGELAVSFEGMPAFDPAGVEEVMRGAAKTHGLKPGQLFGAVRVALTGRTAAPGIFEVVVALGRERVVKRVRAALEMMGGGG